MSPKIQKITKFLDKFKAAKESEEADLLEREFKI